MSDMHVSGEEIDAINTLHEPAVVRLRITGWLEAARRGHELMSTKTARKYRKLLAQVGIEV